MRKENNNNTVYSAILLHESSAILESIPERNQSNECCLRSACARCLLTVTLIMFWGTLQNGGRRLLMEKNCWINYVIIVFFAHKKYSCSFVKLRLNPWYHMVSLRITTFLCVDHGSILTVYGGSESSQILSKIYYFVFQRWTKVLWVWNDMRVSN